MPLRRNELSRKQILDPTFLQKMIDDSPLAQRVVYLSDRSENVVRKRFLGMGQRFILGNKEPVRKDECGNIFKMRPKRDGKRITNGFFWNFAFRPKKNDAPLNPVHIIAWDPRADRMLFIVQPRAPFKGPAKLRGRLTKQIKQRLRQFQPKLVLSLPAGLVEMSKTFGELQREFIDDPDMVQLARLSERRDFDKNDPVIINAVFELKEETGFFPKSAVRISSHWMPKSAGAMTESAHVVFCKVDSNKSGQTKFDDSEDIKYLWMKPQWLPAMMKDIPDNLLIVEYDTFMLTSGLRMASEFNK